MKLNSETLNDRYPVESTMQSSPHHKTQTEVSDSQFMYQSNELNNLKIEQHNNALTPRLALHETVMTDSVSEGLTDRLN